MKFWRKKKEEKEYRTFPGLDIRIEPLPYFSGRNIKIKLRNFFNLILFGIGRFFYALTFPFGLVYRIFVRTKQFIKAIPGFIKSIPKGPSLFIKFLRLFVFNIVKYIAILVFKQKRVRKNFLKRYVRHHLFLSILVYLIFSFISEIPKMTNNIHAYRNVGGGQIYDEGLNGLLCLFICYNCIWFISVYVIDLQYTGRNHGAQYSATIFGFLDIMGPDFVLQSVDVFMQEVMGPFYFFVGLGNGFGNEGIEDGGPDIENASTQKGFGIGSGEDDYYRGILHIECKTRAEKRIQGPVSKDGNKIWRIRKVHYGG